MVNAASQANFHVDQFMWSQDASGEWSGVAELSDLGLPGWPKKWFDVLGRGGEVRRFFFKQDVKEPTPHGEIVARVYCHNVIEIHILND